MTSHTTERFRKAYQDLPSEIKQKARKAYILWKKNPWHKSLRFKKVHSSKPIYSVRIDINYRAVGVQTGDYIIWFWVGPHDEYMRLISQL